MPLLQGQAPSKLCKNKGAWGLTWGASAATGRASTQTARRARQADEYPGIETSRVYVDAAALYLVLEPQRFDVIVTENMFGDILSDLTAGIVGGMGMAPSADIGDDYGVFQPAHGSAPDIAGRGIANPIATILSAAMMMDWLGREAEGDAVRAAVELALRDPSCRTPDLGGTTSCSEMADAVVSQI